MEPLLIILIPGIFGGLVLSLLIARNRRGTPPTFVSRPLDAPSPALINMAHIKVEGLGGLGLVAAQFAVTTGVVWIALVAFRSALDVVDARVVGRTPASSRTLLVGPAEESRALAARRASCSMRRSRSSSRCSRA